jgi:hypothetical protein
MAKTETARRPVVLWLKVGDRFEQKIIGTAREIGLYKEQFRICAVRGAHSSEAAFAIARANVDQLEFVVLPEGDDPNPPYEPPPRPKTPATAKRAAPLPPLSIDGVQSLWHRPDEKSKWRPAFVGLAEDAEDRLRMLAQRFFKKKTPIDLTAQREQIDRHFRLTAANERPE